MSRKLLAEFLGTLFLVCTVVGSGIMAEQLAGGNVAIALLGNTIPTGAILFVLISVFGPVSGAHFNPVVTMVFWFKKQISLNDSVFFIIAQITGGLLGTVLAHLMFDLSPFQIGIKARTGDAQWLAEVVATFGLLMTILGLLRHKPDAIAMSVGLYITAAYWFTASTSFANPAVTIARAFTTTFAGIDPNHVLAFVIAQVIGASLAFLTFNWLEKDASTS